MSLEWSNESSASMFFQLLLKRGTLCCPPNFPLAFIQSLNSPLRATITSNGCKVMS